VVLGGALGSTFGGFLASKAAASASLFSLAAYSNFSQSL